MDNIFKNWNRGPDEVMPAEKFVTDTFNDVVKLRYQDSDKIEYPPLSIYSIMKQTCLRNPQHPAHITFNDNYIETLLYGEYWNKCILAAKSLIKMEVDQVTCVSFYAQNSSKWLISEIGTYFAGGIASGYTKLTSLSAIEYGLKDTNSNIIFVENNEYALDVLKIRSLKFKWIVQMNGTVDEKMKLENNILSWNEFLELGNEIEDERFESRIRTIAPNKCAVIIYTSGTTSKPKACMVSHDSLTYRARLRIRDSINMKPYNERFISHYLYSHSLGRAIDLATAITTGATVYFGATTDEKFLDFIRFIKPTLLIGTLKVWSLIKSYIEKNKLTEKFSSNYEHLKEYIGLDECRNVHAGASIIPTELLTYFRNIGVPVVLSYGATEVGSIMTAKMGKDPIDSVGNIKNSYSAKIGLDNELVVYNRGIFMGYLNGKQKNEENFDSDYWYHTGDIVSVDKESHIFIVGRLKELIKVSTGIVVVPTWIENAIKVELEDIVSNCMAVGYGEDYLCALVTLKCKNYLSDELDSIVIEKLKSFNLDNYLEASKVAQLDKHHPFMEWLFQQIKKANEKSMVYASSRTTCAEIKDFAVLPRDFTQTHGELTGLNKLSRRMVVKNFYDIIKSLYNKDLIII